MLINCHEDIEELVEKFGFLPFFKNDIIDYSIEEMTPDDLWFSDEKEGPWDWKGPILRDGRCAYGKFFAGKAGYVSLKWLPDWINYRREKYKLTPKSEKNFEGKDLEIYKAVVENESLTTKEIKSLCGYGAKHKRSFHGTDLIDKIVADSARVRKKDLPHKPQSFETIITYLQMSTMLVTADFEYALDRHDHPYGWGIARYATPEAIYGEDFVHSCGHRRPSESLEHILSHLKGLLPQATEKQIYKIII